MEKKITLVMLLIILFAAQAKAVPITYSMTGNPNSVQDPYSNGWTQELGNNFTNDDAISSSFATTGQIACLQQYANGQNFMVTMTNLTNTDWMNVAYVSDPSTNLTNDDTFLINGQEAFYIDSVGANVPLFSESSTSDGIFESGETWQFIIQEYTNSLGLPASFLGSWDAPNVIGQIGSQSNGSQTSSGSIIADPVPEPATLWMLGLGCLAVCKRKA